MGDLVGLCVLVAVEDGHHVRQLVVHDEVDGLPDLSFTGLAVTDDAVDPLVETVVPGGEAQSGGDGQSHAEGTGRRIEEGEALDGVRMPVDVRVDVAQGLRVLDGHRAHVAFLAEMDAEIGAGGVDDRDGVSLGEDESIGGRVPRVVGHPAHGVVHEDGRDVTEAHRRSGMSRTGFCAHVEGEVVQLNRLGVNGCFEGHGASPDRGEEVLKTRSGERVTQPRQPRRRLPAAPASGASGLWSEDDPGWVGAVQDGAVPSGLSKLSRTVSGAEPVTARAIAPPRR